MQTSERIEQALHRVVSRAQGAGAPSLLASAIGYAVFPGGHRIRPRLCLAVAQSCGDGDPAAADAAAASIELLHCASLVHDDLPCFDDAGLRRGKASVHVEFGSPIAVLTGDALIVMAFETLAQGAARDPSRMAILLSTIAESVGSPNGIVAGQAWECEAAVPLTYYQRAKTGALFVRRQWRARRRPARAARLGELGAKLGEAYQVADDLRDILCDASELGKPIGQDAARLRPNAAAQLGLVGAKNAAGELVKSAVNLYSSVPRSLGTARTDQGADRAVLPEAARARGGLTERRRVVRTPPGACAPRPGAIVGSSLRNRLIADPRFQRWAAASPLTRLIARRRTRELFDLCAGFVYSQILLACVRLRLFETWRRVRAGWPLCAAHSGFPRLHAAPVARRDVACGLCARCRATLRARRSRRGRCSAIPRSPRFIEHHRLLYDDLRDPVALLRGEVATRLSALLALCGDSPRSEATRGGRTQAGTDFGAYSALMSARRRCSREDILDAYPVATPMPARCRRRRGRFHRGRRGARAPRST